MQNELADLVIIFSQTKTNVQIFMDMLSPYIESTTDQHLRMYFHHIYEEEEQHLERLNVFIPKLEELEKSYDSSDATDRKLVSLLQDINLEKFGQHNFLEHLELSLYHFATGDINQQLHAMIDRTNSDYLMIKDILFRMNEVFLPEANVSRESDHHDVQSAAHTQSQHINFTQQVKPLMVNRLTVGSLKVQ